VIHSNAPDRKAFREEVEALADRVRKAKGADLGGGRDDALRAGVGYHLLGRHADALELFAAARDTKERRYYQALAERELGDHAKALESLSRAAAKGWDALAVDLEAAEIRRRAGEHAEVEKLIKKNAKAGETSAEWHYQKALLSEAEGRHEQAVEELTKAVNLDPDHRAAAFKLAFIFDLRGDEREAIRLYKQCVANPPTHVNALINLAVLYEDAGQFPEAIACLDQVLRAYPDHPRATLFKKDAISSTTMVFDEVAEIEKNQRNQVLEIPVTDFELSVRSRNCLKKMNIKTLGDLLHITENELLSYKNFGETSLNEIKEMLSTKGLRLGQALEEGGVPAGAGPVAAATNGRPKPKPPAGTPEGVMAISVADIEFSVRSKKCLQRLGVQTLGDLTTRTEAELLAVKNFGQTSLQEIKNKLAEYGLGLRVIEK
jgi:DNA-directed RNA polymerase subunit alpha